MTSSLDIIFPGWGPMEASTDVLADGRPLSVAALRAALKARSDRAVLPLLADGTYGPSLTVQSQAEDADINVLMRRFGVTGKFPENSRVPTFGDFSHITDFRSALHAVMDAQVAFMELPADVRSQFDNDPQMLLEFVSTATPDQMKGVFGEHSVSQGVVGAASEAAANFTGAAVGSAGANASSIAGSAPVVKPAAGAAA